MIKKNANLREAFRRFMETRSLKPHPWSKKAGIRSSTLYNFLAGDSDSLSSDTLRKLAKAAGATIDDIVEGRPPQEAVALPTRVSVASRVGIFGRLFPMDEDHAETIARPAGIPNDVAVVAARIDPNALHPIPGGWLVVYAAEPQDPESLLRKVAVVKVKGSAHQFLREIRRGATAGLYTLVAWGADSMDDVEIETAHRVLAITQP